MQNNNGSHLLDRGKYRESVPFIYLLIYLFLMDHFPQYELTDVFSVIARFINLFIALHKSLQLAAQIQIMQVNFLLHTNAE